MLNLLALTETGLNANTAVELRKAAAELGIKGASKGRKADLIVAIMDLVDAAKAEAEKVAETDKLARGASQYDDSDEAKKARRSRRGMVIVAKGTEIHKSQTFKAAAEAAGFEVDITVGARMVEEDGEFYEIETYDATATKAGYVVTGSWIGRAWNYEGAGAGVGGHARKVRNLKEALRILAGLA
jgi:capsid portal protein